MKEFIKIFVGLSFLAGAFLAGRNYGEKTYFESNEYKNLKTSGEELSLVRGELESTKTKLQNILDRAQSQKSDELLANLMQVFLADLGMQIQNKEAILLKAQKCEQEKAALDAEKQKAAASATAQNELALRAIEKLSREQQKIDKAVGKIKANEWFLLNAKSTREALRGLDKVTINKISSTQLDEVIEKAHCEKFVGDYKGVVKNTTNGEFGSFKFILREKSLPEGKIFKGNMEWDTEVSNPIVGGIANGCGHKLRGLEGRIFYLDSNKYVQLYNLGVPGQIAGNIYETLPNMTSNRVGKFILSRTDKF